MKMKWYLFSCELKNEYKQIEIKAYNLEQAYNFALYYFKGYFNDNIEMSNLKYYGETNND